MALAEIFAKLQTARAIGTTVKTIGDRRLIARIQAAASRIGMSPDAYLLHAVRIFEDEANDEEWHALLWVAARCRDRGAAALRCMIERALVLEAAPLAPAKKRAAG